MFFKVASNATRTFSHLFCSNTKRTSNRCTAMFQDSGNPSMRDQRQGDCSESCWVRLACPYPCWSDLCLAENLACFSSALHINNIALKGCEAEMGRMAVRLCTTRLTFLLGQAAPDFRVEQLASVCGQAGLQPNVFLFFFLV